MPRPRSTHTPFGTFSSRPPITSLALALGVCLTGFATLTFAHADVQDARSLEALASPVSPVISPVVAPAIAPVVSGRATSAERLALSPHARDLASHASDPVHPDHARPLSPSDGLSTPALRASPLHAPAASTLPPTAPCRSVFGFLPYWVSEANVRWNLLTHVACFNVTANASGTISNTIGWPSQWSTTLASARANNVKLLLTVTAFDPATNSALVNTPSSRTAFATNLARLLTNGTTRYADGVVLDFEGTNPSSPALPWQNQMAGFVTQLKSDLAVLLPGSPAPLVYLATPAVNWAGATNGWNFAALAQVSDGLFIMGYDYYGSWSTTSGPSAPLTGGSYNVTNTVVNQYAAARVIAPWKLILGVPYYGNQWRTSSAGAYAASQGFVGSSTYTSALSRLSTSTRVVDSASQTPFLSWLSGTQWNQVWYDDAQSIGLKFDLAKSNKLGGVGMWALDYDGTSSDLWNVIQQKFVAPCACRGDFDLSGTTSVPDIFDFLAAWFKQSPLSDVDGDRLISVMDIFAFLSAWFGACAAG